MADKLTAADLLSDAKKELNDIKEWEKGLDSLKKLQEEAKKAKAAVDKEEKTFAEADE